MLRYILWLALAQAGAGLAARLKALLEAGEITPLQAAVSMLSYTAVSLAAIWLAGRLTEQQPSSQGKTSTR